MYLGNNLQVAFPSYTNIDDISGSFNGSTTSFPLTVNGAAPVPFPLASNQCLISVNGVVQRPDDSGTEGFRLSGGNIIFSAAPGSGQDFFGIILAGADYINVGVEYPDGSAATPSITFGSNTDTGFYLAGPNVLGVSTNGSSRLTIGSSGEITIDTNTVYVDSVNNRVGVGTATPAANTKLDVNGPYAGNITAVAALDIDCSTANYFTKTINANSTFTVSNVPASRSYAFVLELNHTSGTVTWFSGVEWPGGTAPTLTAGKTHLFVFHTDDGGSRWRANSAIDYTT